MKILITGAGGFIGYHLVNFLKEKGFWVRGVDIKVPQFGITKADEFLLLDLRDFDNCMKACEDISEVYNFAADMGGVGYISSNHALISRNNTLINLNMLESARINGVKNYLFSSSACIYPQYLQKSPQVKKLKEEDAFPADAEPGYGWEKLYSELMCKYYFEDFGLRTHIARFHNIFGPFGAYDGGREKSPAALCRKIAMAMDGDVIEIWGDGRQTRSYCYIDDCIEGIYRLMKTDYSLPVNLGQDRLITINDLTDIISKIAGKKLFKRFNSEGPEGVRGRNCDNSILFQILKWKPEVSLEDGLEKTYKWIYQQLLISGRINTVNTVNV